MYKADLINEAMGRRRLTNESLAELSELSPPTISAIRNGKWDGKLSVLSRVAKALELEVKDLLDDPEAPISTEEVA